MVSVSAMVMSFSRRYARTLGIGNGEDIAISCGIGKISDYGTRVLNKKSR